jgi:DNA polymerase-4/protein ImuB
MGARATVPLIAAIHQLKHRYGESPLYHVVEVEPWSRIPERRHALISYDP